MHPVAVSLRAALAVRGHTVACAESLTGGAVAAELSAPPGASATFVGGVVSYATEVKRGLLGVTAERVVTAECAEQMAAGARSLLGADWAVSTTGVAGPDLQEGQPAGTVFVGISGPRGTTSVRLALSGDRETIRAGAVASALEALVGAVEADE